MGAGQAFILSAFLFRRKVNPLANKIWGFTVLIYAIDLVEVTLHTSPAYLEYPHLIGLSAVFPYMYGPLMFIYISIIGLKLKKLPKIFYLHFIPAVVYLLWGIFNFYNQSAEFKIGVVENRIQLFYLTLGTALIPVSGFIYMYFSYRMMKKLGNKIKEKYSQMDQSIFNQIKHLVYGNIAIWIMVLISYIASAYLPNEMKSNLIIYIPLAFLIFNLGWKSLNAPELDVVISDEKDEKDNSEIKSYKKSGLSVEDAKMYIERLDKLMMEEKPYLNSNLKLSDLASLINISTHNLSEVLNTHKNQTFYDYINSHRIEEVKRIIKEDSEQKLSLLAIAFDSGFSSKSSFNNTFKKLEGTTPSDYRNNN